MPLYEIGSKQWALLTLTLCFLVIEVILSRMCDSLTTLVDSFHTLSVCLSLAMPVVLRIVVGRPCPAWLTFSWNRLPHLWTLTSTVLLSSLCFSVTLNALGRFVNTHPPHRPHLSMGAGVAGIVMNLVVIAASSRQGWTIWEDPDSRECASSVLIGTACSEQEEHWDRRGETPNLKLQKNLKTACDLEIGIEPGDTQNSPSSYEAGDGTLSTVGEDKLATSGHSGGNSPEKPRADETSQEGQAAPALGPAADDECFSDTFKSISPISDGKEPTECLVLHNAGAETLETTAASTPTGVEKVNEIEKTVVTSRLKTEEMVGSQGCWWRGCVRSWLRGLFCSSLVLINSLLYHFMDHECLHARTCLFFFYLDPLFCLAALTFLLVDALPQVRRAGFVLLQGVPGHVSVTKLYNTLNSLPGMVGTHELHVWHLSRGHTMASLHMKCASLETYLALSRQMQAVFLTHGVHSFTIQPEFACANETTLLCSLSCGKACSKHLCCTGTSASLEADLPLEGSSSRRERQELVITNVNV
ncbi:proton-coupled zinc antiporter SLC30A1-like [Lissotriton helveticus]